MLLIYKKNIVVEIYQSFKYILYKFLLCYNYFWLMPMLIKISHKRLNILKLLNGLEILRILLDIWSHSSNQFS